MDDQDKTDPASEHKLKRAREQGQVSRSQDVTYVAVLTGVVALALGMGHSLAADLARILASVLSKVNNTSGDPALLFPLFHALASELFRVMAAPLAIFALLAIVGNLVQVGFTISFDPLTPDFNKVNPASGLKKLFSMRSIFELLRSSLKLVLVGFVTYLVGRQLLPHIVELPTLPASGLLSYLLDAAARILCWLLGLFVFFAAVDFAFNKWEFLKKMRMSKQEVKDEYKQREGDPRVKSRLRELRMEWLKKSRSLKNVGEADMLLTNPTHLAIAIAYKRGSMSAPKIVAKGAGSLAEKMKQVARRKNIPIIENIPLTRALYPQVQPEGLLPEAFYQDVAKLLAWVFARRAKAAGRAA